jgi:hypothetical protein
MTHPVVSQILPKCTRSLSSPHLVFPVAPLFRECRARRTQWVRVTVVHDLVRTLVRPRAAVGTFWRPRRARNRGKQDLKEGSSNGLVILNDISSQSKVMSVRGQLHLRFGCAVWMCVSVYAFSTSFLSFHH